MEPGASRTFDLVTDVIIDDLARASSAMSDLLDKITPEQWSAPTPCTEWAT